MVRSPNMSDITVIVKLLFVKPFVSLLNTILFSVCSSCCISYKKLSSGSSYIFENEGKLFKNLRKLTKLNEFPENVQILAVLCITYWSVNV